VAIVGRTGSGKHSIFRAAASTSTHHERLAGIGPAYEECLVDVGIDQISLVALPAIDGLHDLDDAACVTLKYLLWGDHWPDIARHEAFVPASAFAAPDVLLMVLDATALERDLEFALEMMQLGRPMVFALNRMDEARARRRFINVRTLSTKLGAPVVPTVAHMGIGLADLFTTAGRTTREARSADAHPSAYRPSPHIQVHLLPIATSPGSRTWQPTDLTGVVARSVLDRFIGLASQELAGRARHHADRHRPGVLDVPCTVRKHLRHDAEAVQPVRCPVFTGPFNRRRTRRRDCGALAAGTRDVGFIAGSRSQSACRSMAKPSK